MNVPDLFGGETPMPETKSASPYADTKRRIGYHKSSVDRFRICKTCGHSTYKQVSDYSVYKCDYIGDADSQATDVGANCTCNEWETK